MGWVLLAFVALVLVLFVVGLLWSPRRAAPAAAPPDEPSGPEYLGRHSLLVDGSIPHGPWQPTARPGPQLPPPRSEPMLQEFDQPLYPDLEVPEQAEHEGCSALASLDANSFLLGPSDLPSLGTADRPKLPAPRDAVDDVVGEEDPPSAIAEPETAEPETAEPPVAGPEDTQPEENSEPGASHPEVAEPEHPEPAAGTDSAAGSPDSHKIN